MSLMADDQLLEHVHRHFRAMARSAQLGLKQTKLVEMQRCADGVSEYADAVVRRIAHAFQEPMPVVPPLPADFTLELANESARGFAMRCLTIAEVLAVAAGTLTDVRALQTEAVHVLAFSDAAESRLRIAIREARDLRAPK